MVILHWGRLTVFLTFYILGIIIFFKQIKFEKIRFKTLPEVIV